MGLGPSENVGLGIPPGPTHADARNTPQAKAEAATGLANAAQQAGQRDGHPHRLLTMIHPLNRPGRGDQRFLRRHAASEVANRVRIDATNAGRPLSILGHPVGLAHQNRTCGCPIRSGLRTI